MTGISLGTATAISGLVGGGASLLNSGANAAMQASTNKLNAQLARETNETNKDIAKLNNDTSIQIHREDMAFNAEEAQKTREWNSEEQVMERRAAAGLNAAVIDGNSNSSSAQASAPSAPTMQTPQMVTPQMVAPQLDLASAFNSFADGIYKLKQADISDKKLGSELRKISSEIALNMAKTNTESVSFSRQLEELQRLKDTPNIGKLDADQRAQAVRIQRMTAIGIMQEQYMRWVEHKYQTSSFKVSAEQVYNDFTLARTEILNKAKQFQKQIKLQATDIAYKYGSVLSSGNRNMQSQIDKELNTIGLGLGLSTSANVEASAGVPGFGKVSGGLSATTQFNGHYTDSDESTISETSESSGQTTSTFANTAIAKMLAINEACCNILEDDTSTPQQKHAAVDALLQLDTSFAAYIAFAQRFQSSDVQDLYK